LGVGEGITEGTEGVGVDPMTGTLGVGSGGVLTDTGKLGVGRGGVGRGGVGSGGVGRVGRVGVGTVTVGVGTIARTELDSVAWPPKLAYVGVDAKTRPSPRTIGAPGITKARKAIDRPVGAAAPSRFGTLSPCSLLTLTACRQIACAPM
jgi:hypothetical protein